MLMYACLPAINTHTHKLLKPKFCCLSADRTVVVINHWLPDISQGFMHSHERTVRKGAAERNIRVQPTLSGGRLKDGKKTDLLKLEPKRFSLRLHNEYRVNLIQDGCQG